MADQGVVLDDSGSVALEEIEVSAPGPGEVLVRIEATGVCHSDLHVIEENGWHHALPVLLGHEGAGTIEAVGEGGEGLAEGDRVVLGWKTACGHCAMCKRRRPRQCTKPPAALGRLHRHDGAELTPVLRTGTFATHTVVPALARTGGAGLRLGQVPHGHALPGAPYGQLQPGQPYPPTQNYPPQG